MNGLPLLIVVIGLTALIFIAVALWRLVDIAADYVAAVEDEEDCNG